MPKLTWDPEGQRLYEIGVDHGVLYPGATSNESTDTKVWNGYLAGVAWNGIASVNENPSGADVTKYYADNIEYLAVTAKETFGASIECYTYPEEFESCNGLATPATGVKLGQQTRRKFAIAFRSRIGNDIDGDDYGYKIHIIYNCRASVTSRTYSTINDSPDIQTMSFELTTTAVNIPGYKPTAHLEIDSTLFKTEEEKNKLKAIETALFGGDSENELPHILTPEEIIDIIAPKG